MIRVHVRVDDVGDLEPVLRGDPEVDVRIERGIHHRRFTLALDDVGKAALPRAADLDDPSFGAGDLYVREVPREAPGAHAALERHRLDPVLPHGAYRENAAPSLGAYGHDGLAGRDRDPSTHHRLRIDV